MENTDVPKGMTYRQAARKAVAMCISDFAAKGVRPDSFMVSLGLRRGTSRSQVEELAKGFREAAELWGVRMVGGDTNEARELVVDCVMVGFGSKVVGREGARPGDRLVVTGTFGLQPAGLMIMRGRVVSNSKFRRAAVESVLAPEPSLETGLALGRYLTAGMDSSDGLARSLHTLAAMSGVGFELDSLPFGDGVKQFARKNGLDAEGLVLSGGEEYVVVGTVKPGDLAKAEEAVQRAGGRLLAIGRTTNHRGEVVLKSAGQKKRIPDRGWTHLG